MVESIAPVMYWAVRTTLCSALQSVDKQLPYQAVMQPDALDGAAVEPFEDLKTHAKWGNRFCRALITTVLVCLDHVHLLVMWKARNLKLSSCSTTAQLNGGVLGPPFPVVHNHLLCLDHIEGEVAVLAQHGQVSDLLPIGCLSVVNDQAYHCCVIGKLNDGVGFVPGRAVRSEQGVQEGTEYAPLRGPRDEDQRGGCVVTYPYHLGGDASGSPGSSGRGRCFVPGALAY